jgi:hypothetical protein
MWLIFICSVVIIFCAAMFAAWAANKLFISMKRDNHKYELEISDDFNRKNIETKEKGEE